MKNSQAKNLAAKIQQNDVCSVTAMDSCLDPAGCHCSQDRRLAGLLDRVAYPGDCPVQDYRPFGRAGHQDLGRADRLELRLGSGPVRWQMDWRLNYSKRLQIRVELWLLSPIPS